jgi:hypothetical protein
MGRWLVVVVRGSVWRRVVHVYECVFALAARGSSVVRKVVGCGCVVWPSPRSGVRSVSRYARCAWAAAQSRPARVPRQINWRRRRDLNGRLFNVYLLSGRCVGADRTGRN